MQALAIEREYIENIPWNNYPALGFSENHDRYIQAFDKIVDALSENSSINDYRINFYDNVWDFRKFFAVKSYSNIVSFNKIPHDLLEQAKFFAIHKIIKGSKTTSLPSAIGSIGVVFNAVLEEKKYGSVFLVTHEDIIKAIETGNNTPGREYCNYIHIIAFLRFLKKNYSYNLPVDIEILQEYENRKYAQKMRCCDECKTPKIPDEYFEAIVKTMTSIMRDENAWYNDRAAAGLIVILSQTGLRPSDLMALETDMLKKKVLPKSKCETYYIHYKSKKPSKDDNEMLEFDVFSNELCTEAFKTLLKIREKCEYAYLPYLYVLNRISPEPIKYTIPPHQLANAFKRLMYTHLPEETSREWEGITPVNKGHKMVGQVNIPSLRQFRVQVCTWLYEHDVPLIYIQKYMGHLSSEMQGYYVRPKDTYQENLAYSEKVIQEIAGKDITPIGPMGKKLKENIKKFIADNKFDIYKDIDEIMKAFGSRLVIRGKSDGICIRSKLELCSEDKTTNEVLCAYNLCPNLFHFFYMVDITYDNFKKLKTTYATNKENGHKKAAQKELNKLKDLVRRKLIPELDELEKELGKKGADAILDSYPFLGDIIDARDTIKEEAELWLQKNA